MKSGTLLEIFLHKSENLCFARKKSGKIEDLSVLPEITGGHQKRKTGCRHWQAHGAKNRMQTPMDSRSEIHTYRISAEGVPLSSTFRMI